MLILGRLPAQLFALSSTWVEFLQLWISSSSSRVKAMPPPGKVPRKENLWLQCEWGSCSFVCSTMEKFFEHVTQHLQQHLHGSGEEEEEEEEDDPLGKRAGHRKGRSSRKGGKSGFLFLRGRRRPKRMVVYFPNCVFVVYKNIVNSFIENTVNKDIRNKSAILPSRSNC